LIAGFLLPVLLWLPIKGQFRSLVSPHIKVLLQVLLVSLGLFFLAHLLLFRLHLPSRYTSHTLRALLGITCGISWVIILGDLSKLVALSWQRYFASDSGKNSPASQSQKQLTFSLLSGVLLIWVGLYPTLFFESFPKVGYYNFAAQEKLYEFFAAQPKDSVIASLSVEASNIPMFSARTVLVSPEHAIAYHKGYYDPFRQRVDDLLQAQYSVEPEPLLKASSTYGIDLWLLDHNAFEANYFRHHGWLRQYQSSATAAIAQLESGQPSVLQQAIPLCTVSDDERWVILDADCVKNFAEKRDQYIPKSS
jgi:hypothetical protein